MLEIVIIKQIASVKVIVFFTKNEKYQKGPFFVSQASRIQKGNLSGWKLSS